MWMMAILLALTLVLPGRARASVDVMKDPAGKTIALVLDCSSCKGGKKGKECTTGVEDGFQDDAPCGQCLMRANFGNRIAYPYDLVIMGTLKDENGQPLKGKFVKLFLPNSWTVRTRTTDDGLFRLLLGATVERKGKPVTVQLGTHTMRKDSKAEYYALFLVPEGYAPCEAKTGKEPQKQHEKK